jgi:tRNA(fMet)-specific endonuclease VapC
VSGNLLLDTNAVIAFFKMEPSALTLVGPITECFVPSIVIGELFYGALHSTQVSQNTERIQIFAESVTILDCDRETAKEYGRIKHNLRTAGTPIPENDIWIAAVAIQYSLTLMSNDSHFDFVAGINRVSW